jgi:hypothetical protein
MKMGFVNIFQKLLSFQGDVFMKKIASKPLFGLTAGAKEAAARAAEFNVDFCDLHFGDRANELPSALDACDGDGVRYMLNFEGAPIGWIPSTTLNAELANRAGFLGFMLDEADHMQINAHWPVIDYYGYNDKHYLAETEGLDLFAARQAVLDSLRSRNAACTVSGKPATVEHLFPVMMHTVAKAGLNISAKILKETCGPIMLAVAMGAARQYNTDFWIDVDYWWHNEVIGHSAERFNSALLLAYWSGASMIYVEGGAKWSNNHPVGTAIENAYKDFLKDYVPAHPRPYTWRDFQPEIAIIRYDDTCFDQRQGYLGEYPGPLYGHVPAEPENTEWLNIWSLLSHGFVRTDSASHQWESRRFGSRTLFTPLHNVAVYDHEVEDETLAGLNLIFLTGVMISQETLAAVQRKVQEGATCVLPPRLAPPQSEMGNVKKITIIHDGKGKWLVVPEFYRLHYECFLGGPAVLALRETLKPLVGDGDHLVYNFSRWQTRFAQSGGDYPRHEMMDAYIPLTQAGANPDQLEVEVTETK